MRRCMKSCDGVAKHFSVQGTLEKKQPDGCLFFLYPESTYFTGMGVLRGTGTAATLFWGEPSITRSE